ncbi:DUF3870 domain-containing protein [Alkalihalophilus lindianensis]|uniref:DUF3870 domain-containing protein n=1 Tax=Alkalihalophilus lindianensis TaxID=1630542 RepID=A0ABU3XDS0_9BACI|nr:DUF3870 domain-containing protein [Alkalihalophilus lindianensis]MDV2685978.1 DUF3870 domain-containing protein [Alkalihalophilus lindianensis]
MFDKDSIYLVGEAKSPSNNPITEQYKVFFIGFVVDRTTGKIIEAEATSILSITSSFIRHLFVGKNMRDTDQVIQAIEESYHGSSQKAVIVSFRHASQKFNQIHTL